MTAKIANYPADWPCRKSGDKLWERVVNIDERLEFIRDANLALHDIRLTRVYQVRDDSVTIAFYVILGLGRLILARTLRAGRVILIVN